MPRSMNKSAVEFVQLHVIIQTAKNKASHETFVFLDPAYPRSFG